MKKLFASIVLFLCCLTVFPPAASANETSADILKPPDWQSGAWEYKFIPNNDDKLQQIKLLREYNADSTAYATQIAALLQTDPDKIQVYLNEKPLKRVNEPKDALASSQNYCLKVYNPYMTFTFPVVNHLPYARLRIEVEGADPFELAMRNLKTLTAEMNNPNFYDILFYTNHEAVSFLPSLTAEEAPHCARYMTDLNGKLLHYPQKEEMQITDKLYFKGWYNQASDGMKIDPASNQFLQDQALYAQWSTTAPATVTFDLNQGSWPLPLKIEIDENNLLPPLTDPKRDHYIFNGWLLNQEPFSPTTPITENMTLVADWLPIMHSVTFHLNDGHWSLPLTQNVHEGRVLSLSEIPTKPFYDFVGWQADDTNFDMDQPVLKPLHLKAQWKAKDFQIYFDANGGTLAGSSTYNVNHETSFSDFPEPKRKRYRFLGWYENGQPVTSIHEPERDYHLQARWKKTSSKKKNTNTSVENPSSTAKEHQQLAELIVQLENHPHWSLHTEIMALTSEAKKHLEVTEPNTEDTSDHISALTKAKTDLETFSFQPFINGYAQNEFRPQQAVTRGEFAAMLHKLLGSPTTALPYQQFKDIDGYWGEDAVSYLTELGWINGYANQTFKPHRPITRGEMAAILANYDFSTIKPQNAPFADIQSHWAKDAIAYLYQADIISGFPDGNFQPNGFLTRAEAVSAIHKAFQLPAQNKRLSFHDVTPGHWAYECIQSAYIF